VPRTIVIVDAIPLGPTGKPQRVGMAQRLGVV
jgi:acyl-CoA synthetase (AMP-forming)/AMP-acid ligase II